MSTAITRWPARAIAAATLAANMVFPTPPCRRRRRSGAGRARAAGPYGPHRDGRQGCRFQSQLQFRFQLRSQLQLWFQLWFQL
ncbi:MAG: hypothetical protein M5U32_04380 [Myxococcota bacterium]|nr:hypothetical protein [Myxococcota bacterium]